MQATEIPRTLEDAIGADLGARLTAKEHELRVADPASDPYVNPGPPLQPERPHVALIGKMGAGKTTAAELLVQHYGYQRHSFAARLRDVAVDIWGQDAFNDRGKLQRLGTKVREIDPEAWLNVLLREFDTSNATRGYAPWAVDDCRFENELWSLKERGFIVVWVYAPEPKRIERLRLNGKLQDLKQLDDESEHGLDNVYYTVDAIDYRVDNHTDEATLLDQLHKIITREEGRRR